APKRTGRHRNAADGCDFDARLCALAAAERRLPRSRVSRFGGRDGLVTRAPVRSSRFGHGSFSGRRAGWSPDWRAFRADRGARGYRGHVHVGPPRCARTPRRRARGGMAVRAGRRPGGPIPDGVDPYAARGARAADDRRLRRAAFRADPRRGHPRRVPARGRPGESAAGLGSRTAETRRLLSPLSSPPVPLSAMRRGGTKTTRRLSGRAEPRLEPRLLGAAQAASRECLPYPENVFHAQRTEIRARGVASELAARPCQRTDRAATPPRRQGRA